MGCLLSREKPSTITKILLCFKTTSGYRVDSIQYVTETSAKIDVLQPLGARPVFRTDDARR
jgi:hypothetical protein